MVEHRADGADRQAVALRLAPVEEQHAHPVGGLGTILARGGAAEEAHQVRMFGAADTDLLAVDNGFVADITRKGADVRRVSDRQSVVKGTGWERRVDMGGGRLIKKNKQI